MFPAYMVWFHVPSHCSSLEFRNPLPLESSMKKFRITGVFEVIET